MAYRLPPLGSLRAFEAAARHLSFKHAAEELHVTPAAISQQIKGLEDYLGVRLFVRLTRALAITPQGEAMLPASGPVSTAWPRRWAAPARPRPVA
jgi:LysR family glycine cleavage system transcriptional activator